MKTERQRVVYILAQIDRVGQLTGEMFHLQNIYRPEDYEITVVTYPPKYVARTNLSAYAIALRGLEVIHSIDDRIVWHVHELHRLQKPEGAVEEGDTIYFFAHTGTLRSLFFQSGACQNPIHPFKLTQDEERRGAKMKADFGIHEDAPIVAVHIREGGYLPNLSYHSYRDSRLENYLPALEFLLDEGYTVVRLGDPTMQRIPLNSGRLIDAPFDPRYCDFVDPYFVGISDFFLGTASGPQGLAKGFGVPILTTNAPIQSSIWGEADDLIVFKKYFSQNKRCYLSYKEVLTSGVIGWAQSAQFAENNVDVIENTPEELLAATQEMHLRLKGSYRPAEAMRQIQSLIKNIQREVHEERTNKTLECPYLAAFLGDMDISHEFIRLNPDFFETGALISADEHISSETALSADHLMGTL